MYVSSYADKITFSLESLSQQHVSPYQSSQFLTPYQHHQYSTPLSSTLLSHTNEYHSNHSSTTNVIFSTTITPTAGICSTTYHQATTKFFLPTNSSLSLFQFSQKGDDPIDAINHMMSFLTAVVTSRDGTDLLQGEHTSYSAGGTNKEKDSSGASGSNTGKPRTIMMLRKLQRGPKLLHHRLQSLKELIKCTTLRLSKKEPLPQPSLRGHWGIPKSNSDYLLSHISRSCPGINNCGPQVIEVIPRKKDKKVRFAESLTSIENTKSASTSNVVSNKRVLHSTGVRLSTSASGSQPSGNTKNDRILQPPSSNSKNKNLKKQDNSDSVCVNSNDCMSSDNLCVSNSLNDVKSRAKSKKRKSKKDSWKPTGKVFTQIGYIWKPTGRTFTIVGNACPLTRITTTNEVPSRKPIVLDSESPKPVVKLVYSRKPRKNKTAESVSKTKALQPMSANKKEPSKSWGSTNTNIPSTSLNERRLSKLSSVKIREMTSCKDNGFGYYQMEFNIQWDFITLKDLGIIYFLWDNYVIPILKWLFRQHTSLHITRNPEGVDPYTDGISRQSSSFTFELGSINHWQTWTCNRRCLPKLKFEKDHLCSACALGKSSKKPHKPKSEDTNQKNF
ncbi:hypothetical protein Tco_0417236 [Tanacetum coccineum]